MRKASALVCVLLALGCRGHGHPQQAARRPATGDAGVPARAPELPKITGKITDERGAPLARVRVLALAPSGLGLALADSAADGSFVLAVPAGPVHLETRAAGRAARAVDLTAPSQAAPVQLASELTITGSVHDPEGRPIAGALVAARREVGLAAVDAAMGKRRRAPALGEWRDAALLLTRSGADGTYRVGGLARAFYRLSVVAKGFAPVEVRQVLAPSEDMAVSLSREVVLAGRVLDARGAPAGGATVEVAGSGLWPPRVATTGPDGRFEVTGLIEGIYEARARRGAAEASPPLEGIERFGREPQGPVLLALVPARKLAGTVFDGASGAPVPGAHVSLAADTLAALADRVDADGQGAFEVPALPAGSYVAQVSAPGYLPVWGQRVLVPEGQGPVVLELRISRGASLAGLVQDAAGAPVRGARIQVLAADASGNYLPVGEPVEGWAGARPDPAAKFRPRGELGVLGGPIPYPPPRAAGPAPAPLPGANPAAGVFSDGAGRFTLAGLPAGKARVVASHPDFADSASADLTLGPAGATVTLTLSPGAIVKGRVTDPSGAPLADVLVSERGGLAAVGAAEDDDASPGAGTLAQLTDADGRYQLGRLTGKLQLEASRLHYATATQSLDVSEAQAGGGVELTVDFVLVPADRQLEGRVVDALGFGLPGARVRALAAGKQRQGKGAVTDQTGRFVLPRLAAPPYRLEVTHPDYPTVRREVATVDERPEIALGFGGGISGRVLDGRLRGAVAGALVRLSGPDGAARDVHPDARGVYEVVALAAGDWTLTASAPGYAPAARTLTLAAATRNPREVTARDIDLELAPAARVSGRVLDARGDPVAGAEVTLEQRGRALAAPRAQSGGDGGFVLAPVPEGDYDVVARFPGGRATYPGLRLRAGDDRSEVLVTAR